MLKTLFLSASILACSQAAAADKMKGELTTTVQWRMSLDAAGHITALVPKSNTVDAVREKLESAVRSWKFDPGTVNGKPAPTETMLSAQIALVPSADGETYSIRLDDVRTGGAVLESGVPRFPASEARKVMNSGGFAQLVFEVSFDASGAPTDVAVVPGTTQAKGRLLEYGEEAVRNWKYEPERVAGLGVPGKVFVPLCFFVGTSQSAANRAGEKCRWKLPGSEATVEQGQSLALDSSVQLKSDVIGKTL